MKRLYREIIFWTVLTYVIAHIIIGFYDLKFSIGWLMYDVLGVAFFLTSYAIYLFYMDYVRGSEE